MKTNIIALTQKEFPSPTGVNYYEYGYGDGDTDVLISEFPSPTGVNYYEFYSFQLTLC